MSSISAQKIDVKMSITSVNPAHVRVEGKFISSENIKETFGFADSYADAQNLISRISNVSFFDAKGKKVEVKKNPFGEYLLTKNIASWVSETKLDIPDKISTTAHISWLTDEHGLLMLSDLLPDFATEKDAKVSAKIKLELPFQWKTATIEKQNSAVEFESDDAEKAIFLVGKDFRERTGWLGKTEFKYYSVGNWTFTDEEAIQMAGDILREQQRIVGKLPFPRIALMLVPFPKTTDIERWRAETRGSTVVLMSSIFPFKGKAMNRLHEQLRHELFHLWLPNSISLTGNYDWFFEGFTIYQALRTGIRLRYISFDIYLDTISRSQDFTANASNIQKISLLEASKNRWSGENGLVYAKGMMVAFLCDVALLKESKGKRSIEEVFRKLYDKYKFPAPSKDGNQMVIELLKSYPELKNIVEKYVENAGDIKISEQIGILGLENTATNGMTNLKVLEKPDGRQKDLLDKLGYNLKPTTVQVFIKPDEH